MSTDCENTNTLLGQLAVATNLREIYALPLPAPVPGMTQDDRFDNCLIDPRHQPTARGEEEQGNFQWLDHHASDEQSSRFDIIRAFDQMAVPHTKKRLLFNIAGKVTIYPMHAVLRPHIDGPTHPTMRLYFYASANPTYIVSHKAMMSVMGNFDPALLDMNFNDPAFYNRFVQTREKLSNIFLKVAQPMEARQLTVMSGATVHFMPQEISETRRFLRGRILDI